MLELNKDYEISQQFKNIENSINLLPYNGRAKNLIDKFYIFGYNYSTLKKYIFDKTPNISEKITDPEDLNYFNLDEDPSTLIEITNNFQKELIDTQVVQNLIFPNKLKIYYRLYSNINNSSQKRLSETIKNNNFNKIDFSDDNYKYPVSVRVVFSSNPIEDNNSQKNQNGFAYIFYRKLLQKKEIKNKKYIIYIPYTFCVISEFPFYKSYEKLFRRLREMYFLDSIYIPIEILLYKIIKLTPSPINNDVILDLKKMFTQDKIVHNLIDKSVNIKKSNSHIINNIKLPKEDKTVDDFLVVENMDLLKYKIKFKILSGYPLIQYNLAKVLFNTLSTEQIINVFLFTFLEANVLLFSKEIEYLTFTANAYMNFNYPHNNSHYFFNIGAISLEKFKIGGSILGGEINSTSLISINNEFVEDYLGKASHLKEHVIVDLDNNDILFAKFNENDNYEKINKLIGEIYEENNDNNNIEDTNLYKAIINLKRRLNIAKSKKFVYDYYVDPKKPENIDNKKGFIYFNDEPYKDSIDELNKYIQEAFYECVINLSLYFYENVEIKEKNTKKNQREKKNYFVDIEYNKDCLFEGLYTDEELLVLRELTETMKFQYSFCQFVLDHNPIDLYKIPLTFTDEFILFISRKKDIDTSKIEFFKLIEELYLSEKINEIQEIDFSSAITEFMNNFKNKFIRDIEERDKKRFKLDYSSIIKVIDNKNNQGKEENKKTLKYQTYELDNRILLNYINLIENLPKDKKSKLMSIDSALDDNIINEIDIIEIEKRVEDYCLDKKYLNNNELCVSNIIIIFAICLKFFPENIRCYDFLKTLFENFVIFRKYYTYLLQIIYKLFKQSLVENNLEKNKQLKLCFFCCFDFLKINKIVPNENLMIVINKFLKLFLEEKEDEKKQEINNKNNLLKDVPNTRITEKNLHITYNFTSKKSYDEKMILKLVNKLNKSNLDFGTNNDMIPKIRYIIDKNDKEESIFFSQKQLSDILIKEYNKFYENLDISKVDRKNISDACLNIFIFMRNDEKFKQLNVIWNTLEFVFHLFLNN